MPVFHFLLFIIVILIDRCSIIAASATTVGVRALSGNYNSDTYEDEESGNKALLAIFGVVLPVLIGVCRFVRNILECQEEVEEENADKDDEDVEQPSRWLCHCGKWRLWKRPVENRKSELCQSFCANKP